MFNFIFMGALVFTFSVMYFQIKTEFRFNKNMVLGVTLPQEAHSDSEVAAVLGKGLKEIRFYFGSMICLSLACCLIQDFSYLLIAWEILFFSILLIPNFLFARTNIQLKKIKHARGWRGCVQNTVRIDTNTLFSVSPVRFVSFLPAAFLCLIFLLSDASALRWMHLLMLFIVICSYVIGRYLFRRKSEAVDSNAARTQELTTLRRRIWKRIALLSAYNAAANSLCIYLISFYPSTAYIFLFTLSALFVFAVIAAEFFTRRMQEKLTKDSGVGEYVDEDDHWIWGIFYYNPNDCHTWINTRIGSGLTVNLARKGGKIFCVFVFVILLFMHFFLIGLSVDAKAPIQLTVSESTVQCISGTSSYSVPRDEISDIVLLDELPAGMIRTGGLGMPNLFKGNFSAKGHQNLKVIADPETPPYLLITLRDNSAYLFGTHNNNDARIIYNQLSPLS